MEIYFITSNNHKFEEAKRIIPGIRRKAIDLTEIQSMDSQEIIKAKLLEARKKVNGIVVVEDVSIELSALNGFPGPMAKWFVNDLGVDKIYRISSSLGDDDMLYRCTLGIWYKGKPYYFEGMVKGKIVSPRGDNGFSYDPIFAPLGFKKSFSQMSTEEKNELSHRGIAFKRLKKFLSEKKYLK